MMSHTRSHIFLNRTARFFFSHIKKRVFITIESTICSLKKLFLYCYGQNEGQNNIGVWSPTRNVFLDDALLFHLFMVINGLHITEHEVWALSSLSSTDESTVRNKPDETIVWKYDRQCLDSIVFCRKTIRVFYFKNLIFVLTSRFSKIYLKTVKK